MNTVITKSNEVRVYDPDYAVLAISDIGDCIVITDSGEIIINQGNPITWPADASDGLQAIVDVKAGTLRFGYDGWPWAATEFVVSNYVESVTSAPHIFDVINYWPQQDRQCLGTKDLPEGWMWQWAGNDWVLSNGAIGLVRDDWFKYRNKMVEAQQAVRRDDVMKLVDVWPTDWNKVGEKLTDDWIWAVCGGAVVIINQTDNITDGVVITENDWRNYLVEELRKNPPVIGTKHDHGKPILGAVPPHAELAVGRVLTFGAEKYTVLDFCDTVKTGKIIENTLCQKLGIALNVENKKELSPKVSVAHVIESQPVSQMYAKAVNESAKSQPKTVDVLLVMNETELNQDLMKRKLNSNIFVNTGKDLSQENEEKSMSSKDQPIPLISKEKEKQKDFDTFQNTELLSSNMKVFVKEGVQYVEAKSAHTLTMTIHLVSSEIYFAVSATKLLDCYKILLTLLNHYLNISVDINKFYSTKSGRGNWDKVEDHENRYMDAALRHLNAHRRGEVTDSESGESHLAHAACCILFMLDKQERS